MNLNRCASENVTAVQSGERYDVGVAARKADRDDRAEALAWYFRLLVEQEIERGTTRKDLLKRLGIEKGHLSQIERGKLGIGVPKLIQFSGVFGYDPGEMLTRALAWWEHSGRAYRAKALVEEAEKAASAASKSGSHPSQAPEKLAR